MHTQHVNVHSHSPSTGVQVCMCVHRARTRTWASVIPYVEHGTLFYCNTIVSTVDMKYTYTCTGKSVYMYRKVCIHEQSRI